MLEAMEIGFVPANLTVRFAWHCSTETVVHSDVERQPANQVPVEKPTQPAELRQKGSFGTRPRPGQQRSRRASSTDSRPMAAVVSVDVARQSASHREHLPEATPEDARANQVRRCQTRSSATATLLQAWLSCFCAATRRVVRIPFESFRNQTRSFSGSCSHKLPTWRAKPQACPGIRQLQSRPSRSRRPMQTPLGQETSHRSSPTQNAHREFRTQQAVKRPPEQTSATSMGLGSRRRLGILG